MAIPKIHQRKEVSGMSDKSDLFAISAKILVAAIEAKAVGDFSANDGDANIAKIAKLYDAIVKSVHAAWQQIT